MELFIAIALLCQYDMSTGTTNTYANDKEVLRCQQNLLHCVNLKSISIKQEAALNKCIQERKL